MSDDPVIGRKHIFVDEKWYLARCRNAGFEIDIEYASEEDLAKAGFFRRCSNPFSGPRFSRERYVRYPANLMYDLMQYYAVTCKFGDCRNLATQSFKKVSYGSEMFVCDEHVDALRLMYLGSTFKDLPEANLVRAASDFCKTQEMLT